MAKTEETKNPLQVTLRGARISYPHLHKAKGFAGQAGSEKYSATFILDKKEDAAQIAKLQAAIDAAFKEKFGAKGKALPADKICLKDGATKEQDGYGAGKVFINASNSDRQSIVDQKLRPLSAEDGAPKAGDYVDVVITIWAQDNQFGKRINASLGPVQLRRVGEALGREQMTAEEAFEPIEDSDDI